MNGRQFPVETLICLFLSQASLIKINKESLFDELNNKFKSTFKAFIVQEDLNYV